MSTARSPRQPAWLKWRSLLLGCLAAISSLAAETRADNLEAGRAPVPLFNGQDLSGWVNVSCGPETWSVRDEMIHCTGKPIGELRTERMYQNFVLQLEWRHLKPKGNAGVFVWADALPARGQPFHRAIEVQVLDGREGQSYTSDGDVFPIHGATMVPVNGRGGMRAFPTERRSRPSPEWNRYRIECVDGSIKLSVNGKLVTQGHQCQPRRGYICLESEGSPVQFRNLRIQELPAAKLPDELIAQKDIGFKSLYNGIDLSGWKTTAATHSNWQANDWRLVADGRRPKADSTLWTEQEFGDAEFIVDWRLANTQPAAKDSQAGIFLRGSSRAMIRFGNRPDGSGAIVMAAPGSPELATRRQAARPLLRADEEPGKWNRFVISINGQNVTVKLNGKTVVDQFPLPNTPRSGSLGLRVAGAEMEFANVFVRPL